MKKTILILSLTAGVAILSATGAERVSANYRISSESFSAGGGRQASASYANTIAMGGVSPVGAPSSTSGAGFVAQVYEVTNILLTMSPPTLDEGGARPVQATARLDDGSILVPPPAELRWSVVSGPVQSISTSGLVSAARVYQHTPATVGGTYLGKSNTLALTVLNVGDDDYGLYAGDSLPDFWQVQNFGTNNPNGTASADADTDGQDNRHEHAAGTDPKDRESRFRLEIRNVSGQPTHKTLTFSPRLADRTYTVQYRPNVASGPFTNLTGLVHDQGAARTVTDTTATNPQRCYRIQISPPGSP